MNRAARAVLWMTCLMTITVGAQPAEECMDCAQQVVRTWTVTLEDGRQQEWKEIDALCADCPCVGTPPYEVMEEDVGAGCRITDANPAYLRTGTLCASNSSDDGCPTPKPSPEQIDDTPPCPVPPCDPSPIILAIGQDPYRLTSVGDGVRFDIRNEGTKRRIAWTRQGVENAFLALDRNGNGTIDDGSELFGNFTPLRDGQLAKNGFIALADHDRNGDRVVDERDEVWSRLLLWTDRNHNGLSTADELQAIGASPVAMLSTEYAAIGRRDQWGNSFRYVAKYRLRDFPGPRNCYDVFFLMEE